MFLKTDQSKLMVRCTKGGRRVAGSSTFDLTGRQLNESDFNFVLTKNCNMIDRNHKEADCAIRIPKGQSNMEELEGEAQQASLTSEAELSWDELTNHSQTFSDTSSVVVLHQEEIGSVVPKSIVQPEATRPTLVKVTSEFVRLGSPQASLQLSWEAESLLDTLPHTSKITRTSGSFRLPWSLEAVIRPDSPRMGWSHVVDLAERYYDYCWPAQKANQHHYKSGTYPTISPLSVAIMSDEYSEEDYADDPTEIIDRSGSVVAKTVRLPVSLASDMLFFIFKFLWPGKQQRPSDHASHGSAEGAVQPTAVLVEGSV